MLFTSLYLWRLYYDEHTQLKSAFYVLISVHLLTVYNKYNQMQTITLIINNKNIKNQHISILKYHFQGESKSTKYVQNTNYYRFGLKQCVMYLDILNYKVGRNRDMTKCAI